MAKAKTWKRLGSAKSLKKKLSNILRNLSSKKGASVVFTPTVGVDKILLSAPPRDMQSRIGPLNDNEWAMVSRYSGSWKVDRSVSDTYEALIKVMEFGWVFRKALDASDVIKFAISREKLVNIASVSGLINITENRPWSGEKVKHRRRDLRKGSVMCWVERYENGFVMRNEWDDPLAGDSSEYCELSDDAQTMVLRMALYRQNGAGEVHLRMVFKRIA